MPRIRTEDLLSRIADNNVGALKLKGMQNGSFCMLVECRDGIFIHENPDGTVKEYPKVDHALVWLKRMTKLKEVIVDIEIWRENKRNK